MNLRSFVIINCIYVLSFITFYHPVQAEESSQTTQSVTDQTMTHDSINLILYETKTKDRYAAISYMPYYPAYGMIHYNTTNCKTELTGFVDPFALKKNKLIIHYKKCKVSFDQNGNILSNPQESESCAMYHSKECRFTAIPNLTKINLPF